jgi:hypothetical protein
VPPSCQSHTRSMDDSAQQHRCSGRYRNGHACRVRRAKYSKAGQWYCGAHLPFGDECSICIDACERRNDTTLLACGHRFHTACIAPWLGTHDSCPVCRARVGASLLNRFDDPRPSFFFDTTDPDTQSNGFLLFQGASTALSAADNNNANRADGRTYPALATFVLDFVGDPHDIARTEIESLVMQMLEHATVRVRASGPGLSSARPGTADRNLQGPSD